MTPLVRLLPLLLAAAVALPVPAQTAAPTPAPLANPSSRTAPEPSKQCVTAGKKVDKEQRSLTAAIDAIAHDKKGRESCSSKSMCARYDTAISDMEKRKSRHETRLTRFKEDADKACKKS